MLASVYLAVTSMTNREKIAFKIKLKGFALQLLAQRIATAQAAMDQAQEAANSEQKSSSGDKYETGRAMGQLEKEMYGRQLVEYAKEVKALQAISVESLVDRGSAGAFIRLTTSTFFIIAGMGKQNIDGMPVFFVSPAAPLARLLLGKRSGDSIEFNGRRLEIEEVF